MFDRRGCGARAVDVPRHYGPKCLQYPPTWYLLAYQRALQKCKDLLVPNVYSTPNGQERDLSAAGGQDLTRSASTLLTGLKSVNVLYRDIASRAQ